MARYPLHHRHEPDECGVVFASFKGRHSPLRRQPALASCRTGGHEIWWVLVRAIRREDEPVAVAPDESQRLAAARAPVGGSS